MTFVAIGALRVNYLKKFNPNLQQIEIICQHGRPADDSHEISHNIFPENDERYDRICFLIALYVIVIKCNESSCGCKLGLHCLTILLADDKIR